MVLVVGFLDYWYGEIIFVLLLLFDLLMTPSLLKTIFFFLLFSQHPYIVADITFGSGRFNVIMGLTASCFGLGGTMSNFFGQLLVQYFGHTASILASFVISFFPILLFSTFMPETHGHRGEQFQLGGDDDDHKEIGESSVGFRPLV